MKIILYILLIWCLNLTIYSCGKKDEQEHKYQLSFENMLQDIPTSPQNVTLLGRSDGKGVDLVITGDGFKLDQIGTFHTAAQNFVNYMFDYSDNISKHKSGWNVHRLDAISNTDCIDNVRSENSPCFRESAYGSYYWCGGTERALCADGNLVRNKVSSVFPQYDTILVLVNSTKYGGIGGGYSTASMHSQSAPVALHELGHSFAGLADEYEYGTCNNSTEPSAPNVTINTDNSTVKWKHWFDDPSVGMFEGGKYCETGVWRPTETSIMRSNGHPFYPVNQEAWSMAVYAALTTTYYSKTPSSENVSHSQGSTLNYSIELAMDNSSQQVDWYVDNVSTQVNSTSFNCCDDKTANYIVSAKIWDNTGTIRKDNSTSSSTINWSVNLE